MFAEGFIDGIKVIEVDKHQGSTGAVLVRTVQVLADTLNQSRTDRQAGEGFILVSFDTLGQFALHFEHLRSGLLFHFQISGLNLLLARLLNHLGFCTGLQPGFFGGVHHLEV